MSVTVRSTNSDSSLTDAGLNPVQGEESTLKSLWTLSPTHTSTVAILQQHNSHEISGEPCVSCGKRMNIELKVCRNVSV